MGGVLDGIRVIDFGRFIAGPWCGALLGDFGADVIRIDKRGGGEDRHVVPLADDIHHEAMGRDFEQLYETRYGFRPEGRGVEIVAIRMVARGKVPALRLKRIGAPAGGLETVRKGERPVYFNGRWHKDCPVYDRARLGAGTVLAGLAIIEEYGSTTVLPPGWRTEVDDWGHLVISDRSGEVGK